MSAGPADSHGRRRQQGLRHHHRRHCDLSDNHLGSDVVTDAYTGASFADKIAANGKAVSVSGISIGGADAGNYALQNATVGTTANLTPAPLTVTAAGVNKVYDTTTGATVTLSDNHLGNDVVTDSYTVASFADKIAANGKAVSVSGIGIAGADAANYALQNTTAGTSANITPVPLTVAAGGVNRVYDGTTAASVTLSDNHLGSDVVTDSYAAASFADPNVANGKAVGVSGISIGGADAANYTLQSTTAATTANITPALLTVVAEDTAAVYGQAAPAFGDTITGFVNGETGTVVSGSASLTTTATTASGTGTYPIAAALGTLSVANYTFTFQNGTLTVIPAVLTVVPNSASKVYASPNPSLSDTLIGFVNGDTAAVVSGSVSLTTAATTSSDAGPYTITVASSTLSAANYTFVSRTAC